MLRPLLSASVATESEETDRITIPVDEAYRTLRTNLSFSAGELELTTFVITSASPDEGKSATAWGLAGAFVEQGKRVVLLDGDMRHSSLAETLGINASPGLSEVLKGTANLKDTVCGAFAIDVVPSGEQVANALHLLSSPTMTQVLAELARDYDAVVIDAPSILVAADATVIGARVDGAVIVLRAGKTQRRKAEYAIQQMSNARARVLGTVLNDPSI
jgi:capsular exopolysaccharide synthesis family protein